MLLNTDRTVQSCGDNVGRNSAVHYAPEPIASSVGDMRCTAISLIMRQLLSLVHSFAVKKNFHTFMKLVVFDRVSQQFSGRGFLPASKKQGLRCMTSPHVRLLHFESVSRNPRVDATRLWLQYEKFHHH